MHSKAAIANNPVKQNYYLIINKRYYPGHNLFNGAYTEKVFEKSKWLVLISHWSDPAIIEIPVFVGKKYSTCIKPTSLEAIWRIILRVVATLQYA